MHPSGQGPAFADGYRCNAVQGKGREKRRSALGLIGCKRLISRPGLQNSAVIIRRLAQLHNQSQLAFCRQVAAADIGVPVEMSGNVGVIPRDLDAFGKVGKIKVEVLVGVADQCDDPLHHPSRVTLIVKPGHIGRPYCFIRLTLPQTGWRHAGILRQSHDPTTFARRERNRNSNRAKHDFAPADGQDLTGS